MNPARVARALPIAAAILLAPSSAAALTPAEIAESAIPSVVLIRVPAGLGTGFVVAPDGRIVTNYHVVRGAGEPIIVAADGREFKEVEVIAVDEPHDLAVLRIGAHGLKPLILGDSSTAKPGEHVVAIGNPLGLGDTVSDGLVSAIRDLPQQRRMLQITAPISPGSSGGPVFDDRGDVIGVSTLVIGGGQNLNFAVPINAVKPLLAPDRAGPLAASTLPPRGRNAPAQPSLPGDCPGPQLQTIVARISRAVAVGTTLCDQGNLEACYRIYAAAALDSAKSGAACPGPKRALLDAVAKADRHTSWVDKIRALRETFDRILALAVSKPAGTAEERVSATRQGQAPPDPPTVLNDCGRDQIASIVGDLTSAIARTAPLYAQGDVETCYWIYEGVISEIDRRVAGCPAAKQALQAGLQDADRRGSWHEKAWALRDAFDGMVGAILRRQADGK
jgi:serine protease Do